MLLILKPEDFGMVESIVWHLIYIELEIKLTIGRAVAQLEFVIIKQSIGVGKCDLIKEKSC